MTDELHSRWGVEPLQERLQRIEPGLRVEVVPSITSTNSALLERAALWRAGRAEGASTTPFTPCLLVAEHQTQGRGRMGRTWHAQPGASLTFSLALPLTPQDWSGLSLAVGVALADALDPTATNLAPETAPQRARLGLKWPNDLWLRDETAAGGGRKLGGVLIETAPGSAGSAARVCVVGVGLNIGFPALEGVSSGVGCVQELEPSTSAPTVLALVIGPLLAGVRRFEREGFAGVAKGFAHRDLLKGRAVTTTLPGLAEGVALGVDPTGALQVRSPDDRLHTVVGGEVSVRTLAGRNP